MTTVKQKDVPEVKDTAEKPIEAPRDFSRLFDRDDEYFSPCERAKRMGAAGGSAFTL